MTLPETYRDFALFSLPATFAPQFARSAATRDFRCRGIRHCSHRAVCCSLEFDARKRAREREPENQSVANFSSGSVGGAARRGTARRVNIRSAFSGRKARRGARNPFPAGNISLRSHASEVVFICGPTALTGSVTRCTRCSRNTRVPDATRRDACARDVLFARSNYPVTSKLREIIGY